MGSVFDHIAKTTKKERALTVIGVDPDLHSSGVAIVNVVWSEPPIAPMRIVSAWAKLVEIPTRLIGVAAADAMVNALAEDPFARAVHDGQVLLIAEGQQVYPDEDMKRSELIAKANDLLRLAQVTGGAQAIATGRGWHQRSVLPSTWKQQKGKDVHQKVHIPDRFAGVPVTIGGHYTFDNYPARFNHAIDALGLAQWGAVEAFRGRIQVYNGAP
jgi:hypothetical protein